MPKQKINFRKALEKVMALPFTRITVILILLAIISGSCVQIIDRRAFHNYVIDEAKREVDYLVKKPTTYVTDSNGISESHVFTDSVSSITITNYNTNSAPNTKLHEDSVLDIISKSDGLLSSNGLTFCITLIVGLLATLLLLRIEKIEQLIEENKGLLDKNKKLQN